MKADIYEEIYIEFPEEYREFPGAVRLLNRAIYRLVQAGRCWNNKLCSDMAAIGFEQSKAHPCVFRKIADKEAEIVVVVHVDGILDHAKDQATMERFATELGRKFRLKDMGDAKYYMGCHITRDRKAHELELDQRLYVKSMVEKFGVKKSSRVPALLRCQPSQKRMSRKPRRRRNICLQFPYREVVGALMWVATMTRPDIASALRTVARFCENPGLAHKQAALKVMQYLLHTK